MKENIKGVRLVTGEDIICVLETVGPDYVMVDPVRVAIVPSRMGNTEASFGFAPFPIFTEQKKGSSITISRDHVMFVTSPAQEFIDQYDQIFGSGIITPPKSLITG